LSAIFLLVSSASDLLWLLMVEYRNKRKADRRCNLQTMLQQLLIAKPDIRWESRF